MQSYNNNITNGCRRRNCGAGENTDARCQPFANAPRRVFPGSPRLSFPEGGQKLILKILCCASVTVEQTTVARARGGMPFFFIFAELLLCKEKWPNAVTQRAGKLLYVRMVCFGWRCLAKGNWKLLNLFTGYKVGLEHFYILLFIPLLYINTLPGFFAFTRVPSLINDLSG